MQTNTTRKLFLDVETPNAKNDRICQIGLIFCEDNHEIFRKSYLVNPEDRFDYFNIQIHGITPENVNDALTFKEVWIQIEPYFTTSIIVGHNITFDLRVIGKSLRREGIRVDDIFYMDTCTKARSLFALPSHTLDAVSRYCGYEMLRHHDAFDDTYAAKVIHDYIAEKNLWQSRDLRVYDMYHIHAKTNFCKK